MTVRSLVTTTRFWAIDPNVAIGAQASGSSLVAMLSPPAPTIFRGPLTSFRSWHKDPSGVPYGYSQTQALQEVPPTLTIKAFDWPNPKGYSYSNELRTWIGQPVPVPPVPPFTNYDQPNPRGYSSVIDRWTFIQNVPVINPIPSFTTSWPNPNGPQFPDACRNWTALGFTELEAGVVLIPAEANYDWPNPRGYQYPSDLRTFTLNTSPGLKALTFTPPINQNDWSNPVIRPWTPAPVVFANSLEVLAIAPPTYQHNWPNPVLRIRPSDNYLFSQNSELIIGLDSPPIAQYNWPVPPGYQYGVALRTWTQGIIAAEDTPPPNQYDWPNPVRSLWSPNPLTFVSGTSRELQALTFTPPATTYDRPNPYGSIAEISIKSGQSYSIPLTLLTFTPAVTTGQHNRYFFADMGSMWSNR